MTSRFDVAVIGAGVFGAWTAYHLHRLGRSVALIDAYGPGNARASSGGESRIIRMGYGADEIYTRMAMRSLIELSCAPVSTTASPGTPSSSKGTISRSRRVATPASPI